MPNELKQNMRVVTKIDHHGIKAGTIATLNKIVSDTMGIIQYEYNEKEDVERYTGIPLENIIEATNIENVDDYRRLINRKYHIGKKFTAENNYKLIEKLGDNQTLRITKVILALKVEDDQYEVYVEDENGNYDTTTINHKTLSSSLFTEYNELVEAVLADELAEGGEYINLGPGIRVKLKNPLEYGFEENDIIIATVMEIYSEDQETKLWFVNEDEEETTIDNVPLHHVYPATQQEIDSKDVSKLIDKEFSIGSIYEAKESIVNIHQLANSVYPGEKIKIKGVKQLASYVVQDIFDVVVLDSGKKLSLTAYDIYSYFTRDTEFESSRKNEPLGQLKTAPKTSPLHDIDIIEEDVTIHSLTINGFRFEIDDEDIIQNDDKITSENLDSYIISLQKLKKFLK